MIKTLTYFQNTKLPTAVAQLFRDLDVPLNLTGDTAANLGDLLEKNNNPRFAEHVGNVYWVGQVDDNAFEGITSPAAELTKIRGKNYDTILVFALEIQRENGLLPTRTQLFELARAFNREFPYQPVVLIFRYHEHLLSVAVVERNDYKVKHLEGDKIGKMSLLRDVDTRDMHTHAGHKRILQDMAIPRSGKTAVTTFETLYRYWQQALNVSVLNKKFYQELSNWYFWATHHVRFPGEPTEANEESLKTHRANNVIRLITRLIFSWFLKEKKLISDTLFDLDELTDEYLQIASLTPENSETSEFYLAILQNLFFATLNQEMDARRFKTETKVFPHPDHSIKNIYRHAALFKNKDKAAEALFKNIPFLNGGLFECLDDEKATHDGFSETRAKQPSVPNFLFFQIEKTQFEKINEDMGTKGKKYEVRGLINILNDYKFTIAENTPLEEEVALDPELLGRIFENLLASFNPETKTTARKQTGSFYTPREIVNYMVDESLIAYLKNKLTESHAGHLELGKSQVSLFGELPNKKGQISLESQPNISRWAGRETELDKNLSLLFSESNAQPFEDPQDCQDLIAALDACKILDPACGSGAFPMGVLHRMVSLLHKLDPNNEGWKRRQIQKAEQIEDAEARDAALDAIKKAFDRNELDYGRKLYLIENCIFGVDIQPIAVQIAKLRFFISLICDQNTDDTADNRGVLALPNLETKFVAANTLIGLDTNNLIKTVKTESLLEDRKKWNHDLFSAANYKKKKQIREKIIQNRIELAVELAKFSTTDKVAQLANWNPFDQNASAPFFDPKWMFGIEEGFDVVIGNPPYVKEYTFREAFNGLRKSPYYQGKMDLWYLFACVGLDMLKANGNLTFIATNNWTTNAGASKMRNKVLTDAQINKFLDFGSYMIFESADIQTMVMQFQKSKPNKVFEFDLRRITVSNPTFEDVIDLIEKRETPKNELLTPKIVVEELKDKNLSFSSNQSEVLLTQILGKRNFLLDVKKEVAQGIVAPQDFLNKSNQVILGEGYLSGEGIFNLLEEEKNALNLTKLELEIVKPFFTTNELFKYYGNNKNRIWVIYTGSEFKEAAAMSPYPNLKKHLDRFVDIITSDNAPYGLHRARNKYFFVGEKIISLRKCSEPTFTFTDFDCYVSQTFFVIKSSRINQKYLTSLLNSKLIKFWLQKKGKMQGNMYQVDKEPLLEIPIHQPVAKTELLFAAIVDKVIFSRQNDHSTPAHTLERVLDGMVCELYFPALMKEKEVDILAQVESDLAPYSDFEQQTDAEKAASIEALHRLWTHPDSIVRNRLALMPVRSPEVLGVILEGK